MNASIRSAAVDGIDAYQVIVEVDAATGLPSWTIVGLPASAVRESRERVNAALLNSGFTVPPRHVTCNLAPGDVVKHGTAFDLPIALAMLAATEQMPPESLSDLVAIGELSLDGHVRGVRGTLSIARFVACMEPSTRLLVPTANVGEAALVASLARTGRIVAVATLGELVAWLTDSRLPAAEVPAGSPPRAPEHDMDFSDVVGQSSAKRALEVAAAGGHNVLLIGSTGAGKTMLARRIPSILPALSEDEALEVIAIQSIAGLLAPGAPLPPLRPFRSPHHTVSHAGLIGGGAWPRPGEVSLAHHGVLFLDEMFEFSPTALEALRQPVEDGSVIITRAQRSVTFPSRFTLVGAANPCPCGRAGDPLGGCACPPGIVNKYRRRLSGPLADRIDMHVFVPSMSIDTLATADRSEIERSAVIRVRVESARTRQRERYQALPGVRTNAQVSGRWLDECTPIEEDARTSLIRAATLGAFSARGFHRTLKVARTIADLSGEERVTRAAVAEALYYRSVEAEALS